MFLIGSFIIVTVFILLFCVALILEKLGYGNTYDIRSVPGLLAYISMIVSMLLLVFMLLYIGN